MSNVLVCRRLSGLANFVDNITEGVITMAKEAPRWGGEKIAKFTKNPFLTLSSPSQMRHGPILGVAPFFHHDFRYGFHIAFTCFRLFLSYIYFFFVWVLRWGFSGFAFHLPLNGRFYSSSFWHGSIHPRDVTERMPPFLYTTYSLPLFGIKGYSRLFLFRSLRISSLYSHGRSGTGIFYRKPPPRHSVTPWHYLRRKK